MALKLAKKRSGIQLIMQLMVKSLIQRDKIVQKCSLKNVKVTAKIHKHWYLKKYVK